MFFKAEEEIKDGSSLGDIQEEPSRGVIGWRTLDQHCVNKQAVCTGVAVQDINAANLVIHSSLSLSSINGWMDGQIDKSTLCIVPPPPKKKK